MENKKTFKINGPYIELLALLKALGIAQTGGHAKMIVDDEEVLRNGEIELRRRAKCIPGDLIVIGTQEIKLV
ncbi:MAG: RNA-binding S4 domain-containing protein [Crocinitomicaceae bacterium]